MAAAYTHELIDAAGRGRGHILDVRASPDDGREETPHATIETVRELLDSRASLYVPHRCAVRGR